MDQQLVEIKEEINELITQNPDVNQSIKTICSIPGVAEFTAAKVLAETDGFNLIHSKRQLASYAGLDVVHKESGISIRTSGRISKQGNRYLRHAMFMPSLVAVAHCKKFKSIYKKLVDKHGIKMKALTAIQRRLLEMIYTLYKSKQPFDENYGANTALQ